MRSFKNLYSIGVNKKTALLGQPSSKYIKIRLFKIEFYGKHHLARTE